MRHGWATRAVPNICEEVVDLLVVDLRVREPDAIFVIAVDFEGGWVCISIDGCRFEVLGKDLGDDGLVGLGGKRRKGWSAREDAGGIERDGATFELNAMQTDGTILGHIFR